MNTQLFGGIVLLVLGLAIVAGCLRAYYRDFGGALLNDVSDYLCGRTLMIFVGAFFAVVGAWNVAEAVAPGLLQFSLFRALAAD